MATQILLPVNQSNSSPLETAVSKLRASMASFESALVSIINVIFKEHTHAWSASISEAFKLYIARILRNCTDPTLLNDLNQCEEHPESKQTHTLLHESDLFASSGAQTIQPEIRHLVEDLEYFFTMSSFLDISKRAALIGQILRVVETFREVLRHPVLAETKQGKELLRVLEELSYLHPIVESMRKLCPNEVFTELKEVLAETARIEKKEAAVWMLEDQLKQPIVTSIPRVRILKKYLLRKGFDKSALLPYTTFLEWSRAHWVSVLKAPHQLVNSSRAKSHHDLHNAMMDVEHYLVTNAFQQALLSTMTQLKSRRSWRRHCTSEN